MSNLIGLPNITNEIIPEKISTSIFSSSQAPTLQPIFHGAFQFIGSKKLLNVDNDSAPILNPTFSISQNQVLSKIESHPVEKLESKQVKVEIVEKNSEDYTEAKKALRAEKNRRFAKESRERKRKYVEGLEAEIKDLRMRLSQSVQRLKKYEFIEKYSYGLGSSMYEIIKSTYEDMYLNGKPLNNASLFMEEIKRKVERSLEEQRLALKQLTRMMINVVIPFNTRLSMWMIDNHVNFSNCEESMAQLSSKTSEELIKMYVNCMRQAYPDKKRLDEIQIHMANAGSKLRLIAKQVIDCQKEAQSELKNFSDFISVNALSGYDARLFEMLAKITFRLASIPELSDYSLYQLKETDLGIENSSDFIRI